jgi:hypothetical protein
LQGLVICAFGEELFDSIYLISLYVEKYKNVEENTVVVRTLNTGNPQLTNMKVLPILAVKNKELLKQLYSEFISMQCSIPNQINIATKIFYPPR